MPAPAPGQRRHRSMRQASAFSLREPQRRTDLSDERTHACPDCGGIRFKTCFGIRVEDMTTCRSLAKSVTIEPWPWFHDRPCLLTDIARGRVQERVAKERVAKQNRPSALREGAACRHQALWG